MRSAATRCPEKLATAPTYTNPTPLQLRSWALQRQPRVTRAEFGNLNYTGQTTERLPGSLFVVADSETAWPRMTREEGQRWASIQEGYLAQRDAIIIDGYVGADPALCTGCRLITEGDQANIAAMQQQLWFPPDAAWRPESTVIVTPGLPAPGKPGGRLITIEGSVTRILGSDYFGEARVAGLRVWRDRVHDRGGLAVRAGCKLYPAQEALNDRERVAVIVGSARTGRTGTTFRRELGSVPVQDGFVALMPNGAVHGAENGWAVRTHGLDALRAPIVHGGVTDPAAWLENVAVEPLTGRVDFANLRSTANGRATFPLELIEHRDPRSVGTLDLLLLLTFDEHITPAVAKLERDQAAAFFFLGLIREEATSDIPAVANNLQGPWAERSAYADRAAQANRLYELLDRLPDVEVYLLNTGRVGGPADNPQSKPIQPADTSAVLQGILQDTIVWSRDRDFGYHSARYVPGIDETEILQPRFLYERHARGHEYAQLIDDVTASRRDRLQSCPALDPSIAAALA